MAEEKGILATSHRGRRLFSVCTSPMHLRFCMTSQRKIPQSQQSTKHLMEIASILNKSLERERARACSNVQCSLELHPEGRQAGYPLQSVPSSVVRDSPWFAEQM